VGIAIATATATASAALEVHHPIAMPVAVSALGNWRSRLRAPSTEYPGPPPFQHDSPAARRDGATSRLRSWLGEQRPTGAYSCKYHLSIDHGTYVHHVQQATLRPATPRFGGSPQPPDPSGTADVTPEHDKKRSGELKMVDWWKPPAQRNPPACRRAQAR
jgi:hypothetical protein